MLRVLTEFSEENSSPERNEMLVVSLRRSLIREPQPPELDGGSLAPAWKGGSGATRILRSKRPSVSGPWNAGCGGVGLGGEKRKSCFIGKNRVVFWYGNCFISYSGYFGGY